MNLPPAHRSARGSVLMMTLVITGIIGFALASYLTLVSSQNRSVARSQVWNAVMPVLEAGIEEGLAHLNQNGVTNLFSQGWQNQYGMAVMNRNLGDGRYVVSIISNTSPIIECTGYMRAPMAFAAAGYTLFADATRRGYTGGEVQRSVRVTANNGSLFSKGMVAKGSVDFRGNNVSTDSFDSSDPNFSTNGQWDSAKPRKDNGDVASNSGGLNIINAGNANIVGHVATGPGGTVGLGANGVVGSIAWVNGGNSGIEAGRFSDDMNVSFPPVTAPFAGGYTPLPGSVSTTNFTFGSNAVTSMTLPSPLPAGPITTNGSLVTSLSYPSPAPSTGVATALVRTTSTQYPTNAVGAVTTNMLIVSTNALPSPLPPGSVITNTVMVTNITLPSPLPAGTITTNTGFSTVQYPYSPMPAGPTPVPAAWEPPAAGTYVGVVTNRYVSSGQQAGRGWWHDYRAIQSYVYQTRQYTFSIPNSYTYSNYTYTYYVPNAYTYYVPTTNVASVTTQTYDYVLDSYDYTIGTLSGKVYVRGRARLIVTDSISFKGQDVLIIGPNGSLTIYMKGASTDIAGNGVINSSGKAENLQYYGLDSNTSISIHGNGGFTGAIYAPNANFQLGGGGNNNQDFIGASVTATVVMNGHFNFHYDEYLSKLGPKSLYELSTWNEIDPFGTRLIRAQSGATQ